MAAKFTFAATRAHRLATGRVTAAGAAASGSDMPLVLIHHPSDGDPAAANPFAQLPPKPFVTRAVAASDAVAGSAARGLVFLSAGQDWGEVWLPLAAGGAPFGEVHALYGSGFAPRARPLVEQPASVKSCLAADPLNPDVNQAVAVHGTVLPLFDGVDPDLLGPHPDPRAEGSSAVSRLKVHGTAAMPSPTAVIGSAYHVLAAVSDLAIDRDATDADELAQLKAVGRYLPLRETKEPFLAWCDEAGWDQDLVSERFATEPSYARLKPFGKQGELQNLNAWADNSDGQRVRVASEGDNIHVDLQLWKYASLFASYADYRRVMSRHISMPVNLSLDLAARPAEAAFELLRAAAFGKTPPGGWDDWIVTRCTLAHRDALHREPVVAAGGAVWLDSPAAALGELLAANSWPRYAGERRVVVHGQRAFERAFMPGRVLDLSGLHVVVEPAFGETTPPLVFTRPLAVKAGSGGVLEVAQLAVPAILNAEAGAFSPLVIRTGALVLTGHGPFEAVIAAGQVRMDGVTDHAVIRGSLVVDEVPANLPRPLVVAWDPRADPTGEAAPFAYRIAPGTRSRSSAGAQDCAGRRAFPETTPFRAPGGR